MKENRQVKPLKIACMGEAMIELIVDEEGSNATLAVSGDSMNTAIYLKRCLGSSHEVAYVTMLGNGQLSDRIERFLRQEDISTNLIKRHPVRMPGLYSIATDENGERSFSYWRDTAAARLMLSPPHGLVLEELNYFDVLFLSAISLAILPATDRDRLFQWIETFRQSGGCFIFDSNYRPALWPDKDVARNEIDRAWSQCDIGLPSIDDEMAIFAESNQEDVLKRFEAYGLKAGVLKRGELGPMAIGKQVGALPKFAKKINVVDTTAAGDSFNGGFLATYLTTGNLIMSMKNGHDLANKVIGYRGAIIPR